MSRRVAWPVLVLLLALPATRASAVALAPGDLLMLTGRPWTTTWALLRIDRATGTVRDTVASAGALVTDPNGLVATPDGSVIVADRAAGLVRVDPATGAQTVLTPAASFGGAPGPLGVAREANGNLVVVCGDASGIWRVSSAGTVLGAFSAGAHFVAENAIAVAPDGGLWVADGSGAVVRVDPVTGDQAPLTITGVTWATPDGIALGPGANTLYVAMEGSLFYHHLAGTYAIDRASGAGAIIANAQSWVQGVAADPASGDAFVSSIALVAQDEPYQGILTHGAGGAWSVVNTPNQPFSGLLAIVPPAGNTPAVPMTWGRLKAMMR